MNTKTALLAVLVFGVFLVGCTSSQTSEYGAYNQPQQGQPQGQVGGGCGVAPNAAYEDTPVKTVDSANSAL